jgi:hypothetical protein
MLATFSFLICVHSPDIILIKMESKPKFVPGRSLKLMDQVRETLRY